jgi:hypothetical protein
VILRITPAILQALSRGRGAARRSFDPRIFCRSGFRFFGRGDPQDHPGHPTSTFAPVRGDDARIRNIIGVIREEDGGSGPGGSFSVNNTCFLNFRPCGAIF